MTAPAMTPISTEMPAANTRGAQAWLHSIRFQVGLALGFLLAAKGANVSVPLLLKHLVDALDLKPGDPRERQTFVVHL